MSFSAGASNVANAIAPLVGSGALDVNLGIVIATLAIGLGGFTIARRTMESVGNDLTELPLLAALVVAITAASITTFLSWIGIPISLVMAVVMTIVGLGWGRASRTATVGDIARGEAEVTLSTGALTAEPQRPVPRMGEESPEDLDGGTDLVNPRAVAKFVSLWIIGPSASAGLSYLFFTLFHSCSTRLTLYSNEKWKKASDLSISAIAAQQYFVACNSKYTCFEMSPAFVAKGEKVVQLLGRNERILGTKYPRFRRSTAFSTEQEIPLPLGD